MKARILTSCFFVMATLLLGQETFLPTDEDIIGNTFYDLQTWRTMQNRIFHFDDHTKGAVWNMGMDYPGFPDLGVGYNYYDGSGWGPYPSQSITSGWAINPSYTAYMEDGEICISQGENGLFVNIRETKGDGDWQEGYLEGAGFKHPVVITSGADHSVIQLLYLDADESFNPTNAQPIRGHIRYSRSTDGGQTWDPSNILLDGLGYDYYVGFTIGSYCWAAPNEDVIAFVAGDYLTDLVLMKSEDGGDTWQKTVVWEHPYPLLEIFTMDTDTFYCNDGGIDIALDNQDRANVVFSVSRVYSSTEQDSIWYDPKIDGVVYWNEDRPTFSNDVNALCPYGNCSYSELLEDYSLVGWVQDLNGNDTIDLLDDLRTYPTPGLSTMPQIIIDEWSNEIYITFSAVTEGYDNGIANYRHIWARLSPNGEWWGVFYNLNEDLTYITSECVYPSLAPRVDDGILFTFQEDNEPGLTDPLSAIYTNNNIRIMSFEVGIWPSNWVDADFDADTTTVYEGDSIYFINESDGYPPNQISYEWWFDGGVPIITSEANPIVIFNEPGIFDVKLIASVPQTAPDELLKEDFITVLAANNINKKIINGNIEIFPNPGNGLFTINLDQIIQDDLNIKVYNILGEYILHYEKIEDQISFDLSDQENGIYFIQIKTGSLLITKKIAVQH